MYKVKLRKNKIERRKIRVRSNISGTGSIPRVSVNRSNKYFYAQMVDDVNGKTLVSVDSETKKVHKDLKRVEAAFELGKIMAAEALKHKIKQAVFDRKGYRYHGRVKSFAEGLREGGIKI